MNLRKIASVAMCVLSAFCFGATVQIDGLPSATTLGPTDIIPIEQAGTAKSAAISMFASPTYPATPIDYWCDSNNGNDSNNGKTKATAFKTLAKQTTVLANNLHIALVSNSKWRESLDTSAYSGIVIDGAGSGTKPLIDCSDVITASGWTQTSGSTVRWEKSVTIPTISNACVKVWDKDAGLVAATSDGNNESTANTYWVGAVNGVPASTTFTLRVHLSDGSNPNSNGRVLEMNERLTSVSLGATSRISNVWTRRNLGNDGSLISTFPDTVINCLITEGTKHNLYVTDGSWIEGCWIYDCYFAGGAGPSLGTVFADTASGLTTHFINNKWGSTPGVVASDAVTTSANLSHTNHGSFGPIVVIGDSVENLASAFAFANNTIAIFENVTIRSCPQGIACQSDQILRNCDINCSTFGLNLQYAVSAITGYTTKIVGGSYNICGGYGSSGTGTILEGSVTSLEIYDASISNTSAEGQFLIVGLSSGPVRLVGNKFTAPGGLTFDGCTETGGTTLIPATCVSYNNIFNVGSGTFRAPGFHDHPLSEWKSQTGNDIETRFNQITTGSVASGSAVSLTTATTANVTSVSLTAGTWDVTGVVGFVPGATTTSTYLIGGISTTSATLGATGNNFQLPVAISSTSVNTEEPCPTVRLQLTATTTVYLEAKAGFAVSTLGAYGTIRATPVRK